MTFSGCVHPGSGSAAAKNAVVIAEDDEAARTLAERGPAVYVFMSSKDIYKLKNRLKNFQ